MLVSIATAKQQHTNARLLFVSPSRLKMAAKQLSLYDTVKKRFRMEHRVSHL
jgi:hypothetical protein